MIPTDKQPTNVPGPRHIPPVPPFAKLLPGPVGIILEDFLRHVRDLYPWIAKIDETVGAAGTTQLEAYDPVTDPFVLGLRG